jgi:hypothetical protein
VFGDVIASASSIWTVLLAAATISSAQDGNAGADQRGVSAAETGKRDLVDQVAEDRRPDQKEILLPAATGVAVYLPSPQ